MLLGKDNKWKLVDFGSCTVRAQVYATKDDIVQEEERVQKFTTAMYRWVRAAEGSCEPHPLFCIGVYKNRGAI